MKEVQQLAEGLEFDAVVPDLDSVRPHVESLFDQGEADKARLELQKRLEHNDDVRSAEQNAWLYRRLGDAYREVGKVDEAIEAYERSYEIEPRDRDVSLTLSELLMNQQRFSDGLDVARVVLLNHKRDMPDSEIGEMYRRIGELQEGRGELEDARVGYEKALVKVPENQEALAGLLRVVGDVGQPGDVVEARLKLIRSLDDAEARSRALVKLGDDWKQKFNDDGRALDTYEEAVADWAQNRRAIESIADVAADLDDWRRVCRAYFTLSVLADDPEEKADYLIQSSDVARDELWETEKALAGYQKALEWDATRLDAFKAVTSILVDARDWEKLEEAYLRVISANNDAEGADPKLLGVLWQKLGDLYSEHLERFEDGIFAYEQALEHLADQQALRRRIVELAETRESQLDVAAKHLRVLIDDESDNGDWLDRLGRVYLRKKAVDRAFCVFRAMQARGDGLDTKASGFLDRFGSKIAPSINRQINPSIMSRYIFAPGMSSVLNECFSVLKIGLHKWVGESRRKYGLRRRDRVKLKESLAFVNFYKKVGSTLGYVELPKLWKKEDQVGMVNGALTPEGFIVGEDLLASAREKHIAFVVAKQLFLFLDPFYLATIRPMTDLQGFFLRAMALVREDEALQAQFKKDSAYKALRKNIKGLDRKRLRRSIEQLTDGKDEVVLGPWIEAIEDSANRMGLLFCDDLEVAEECLRLETETLGQRSTSERMQALIDYSLSEKYLSLRPELGLQVA